MDTRSENIKLARARAEVIADYLEAKGVKGSYNLTIMTSYEVRSSAGSLDKNAGADKPATSEVIVTKNKGPGRSAVSITDVYVQVVPVIPVSVRFNAPVRS